MSECDELNRRVDKLVLRSLSVCFAHPRKAEGVKDIGIRIIRVVLMYRVCGSNHESVLGEQGPIAEDDVLQRLPRHGR